MLGGIAAFQRFRHSQFDSGTSNQKGKTISYKLKESGKMFTKIKRKTIGNLFGIQCKKKSLSKRSACARNDVHDETKMDPFIQLFY